MRWRQVGVAVMLAVACGYLAYEHGVSEVISLGLAGLVYVSLRVLIATWFRTRYWLDSKGPHFTTCPNCDQYIYQMRGDFVLRCHRCGWTIGFPIIRWITHSLPAIQFRRSITATRFVVVIVATILIISSGSAFVQDSNPTAVIEIHEPINIDSSSTIQETRTPQDSAIDLRSTEKEIFERTNAIRASKDLTEVSWNNFLHERALRHSKDMADNDYYSHSGPSGETAESRLRQIGSRCGGSASENIHRGVLFIDMRIYESSEIVDMDDPEGIARYSVQGWMNSPGHRRNMIDPDWTEAGVGLYSSEGEVYMTIIFCEQEQ